MSSVLGSIIYNKYYKINLKNGDTHAYNKTWR